MKRQLRIIRIWYYGRMKLCKAIRKRIWIEIKTREFAYWNSVVRKMTKPYPKYEYLDTKTWEVKESDTPISATIKFKDPWENH